jgi:hypothetical protein
LLVLADYLITKNNLVPLKIHTQSDTLIGFYGDYKIYGKEKDSITIVILGDSHLRFSDKDSNKNQAYFLHQLLQKSGISARIVVYGYGGYSFLQSFLYFDKFLKKFNPDIILYQLYSGNDFYDLLRNDDRPTIDVTNQKIQNPYWINFRPNNENTSYPKDSRIAHIIFNSIPKTKIALQNKVLKHNFKVNNFNKGSAKEFSQKMKLAKSNVLQEKYSYLSQFLQQYLLSEIVGNEYFSVLSHKTKYSLQIVNQIVPKTKIYFINLPSAANLNAIPQNYVEDYNSVITQNDIQPSDIRKLEDSCMSILTKYLKLYPNFQEYILNDVLNPSTHQSDIFDETMHLNPKGRELVGKEMFKIVKKELSL